MEKRLIIFFIVSFAFLFVYSTIYQKNTVIQPVDKQIVTENTAQSDSPNKLDAPSQNSLPDQEIALAKRADQEKTQDIQIGNYSITLSLTGGYIKNIEDIRYKEQLFFNDIGFIPELADSEWELKIIDNGFIFLNPNGIEKKFVFQDNTYTFSLKNIQKNYTLVLFRQLKDPSSFSQRYQEVFLVPENETLYQRYNYNKLKKKPIKKDRLSIIGARDRYFCLTYFEGISKHTIIANDADKYINFFTYLSPSQEVTLTAYLGPQLRSELSKYNLQGIISYGTFHFIGVIIYYILSFFYAIFHNWGISIVLLSIFIYLMLFPFTAKSTKSMKKMQELQPLMQMLQEKYKDNPQRLNKEIIMLYKKHNVNPASGCLPLFFQFPVFIALYQVLWRFVELKGAHFLWIKDLSQPDHTFTLPISLPFLGQYLNVLPIFIVILSLLQQKLTMSGKSKSMNSPNMNFFLILIGIIFYHFPSGLVLYWLTQNIMTFLYQRRLYKNPPVTG